MPSGEAQPCGDEVFHLGPVEVGPLDLGRVPPVVRPVHLAGTRVQGNAVGGAQPCGDEVFHLGRIHQVGPLDLVRPVVRPVDLAAGRDRDHRHGRERPFLLAEPQPERSERRAVRRPQEQKPPKVSQEGLIHSLEPFWKGSRPLLEIPMGEDLSDRVESRFVAELKLDLRG